jgi:hypothetical protein
MAKQNNPVAKEVEKATSLPVEFTPEWINKNKESILSAVKILGVKLVDSDELNKLIRDKSEIEQAAADLGVDLSQARKSQNKDILNVTDLVNKVASQIDILYGSVQWRDMFSRKQKTVLHAVRVFIRQLRNEGAPVGQAATLSELLGPSSGPSGVLNVVGRTPKLINVTNAHLQAAGVLPSGENLGGISGPRLSDLDE